MSDDDEIITCRSCGGEPQIGLVAESEDLASPSAEIVYLCLPCAKSIASLERTPVLAKILENHERMLAGKAAPT